MKTFLPVSYNIPFSLLPDGLRKNFLHELAVNGAKHVVLGAGLLPQLMARPELPEQISAEMSSEGLTFMDSHAPYGLHWDLGAPFENEFAAKVLRMRLCIELAAFFNVRTMTIHMGKKMPEITPEERLETVCRTLEALLPFAEEHKVTICLENAFAYLGYPHALLEVKKRFPVDVLGFCLDVGHANMSTAPDPERQNGFVTQEEVMEALLPYAANCHVHDNDGMLDKHDLPGRGKSDWSMIAAKLRKAPRLQVIQSEVNIHANGVAVRELVEKFELIFREDV